jgi:two-component system sensor histidine kinase DesK
LPAEEVAFTATEETVLSLAVREAVTNIVRHAQAATCTLIFTTQTDGSRILLVEDDGHSSHLPREGNGLRGMRERVQALGGQLSISTGNARGTALRIEIPSPELLPAAHALSGPSS